MTALAVCTAILGLAALGLTVFGALRGSPGAGRTGAVCWALCMAGMLVLGLQRTSLLLVSLVLLAASRIRRGNSHEL